MRRNGCAPGGAGDAVAAYRATSSALSHHTGVLAKKLLEPHVLKHAGVAEPTNRAAPRLHLAQETQINAGGSGERPSAARMTHGRSVIKGARCV